MACDSNGVILFTDETFLGSYYYEYVLTSNYKTPLFFASNPDLKNIQTIETLGLLAQSHEY